MYFCNFVSKLLTEISFIDIHKYVNKTLEFDWETEVNSIESILHIDSEARKRTNKIIKNKDIYK